MALLLSPLPHWHLNVKRMYQLSTTAPSPMKILCTPMWRKQMFHLVMVQYCIDVEICFFISKCFICYAASNVVYIIANVQLRLRYYRKKFLYGIHWFWKLVLFWYFEKGFISHDEYVEVHVCLMNCCTQIFEKYCLHYF